MFGRAAERLFIGQVGKWSKRADCKSVALRLRGFESLSAHKLFEIQEVNRNIAPELDITPVKIVMLHRSQ